MISKKRSHTSTAPLTFFHSAGILASYILSRASRKFSDIMIVPSIVNIQPKDSSGGGTETRETIVYKMAEEMQAKLPEDYNPFEVG